MFCSYDAIIRYVYIGRYFIIMTKHVMIIYSCVSV